MPAKRSAIAVLMLVCLAAALEQADEVYAQSINADHKQRISSKQKLLENMAYRSPTAQRIENLHADELAKQQLSDARAAYQRAREYLRRDHLEAAESALDQGLRLFSKAARSAADPEKMQTRERERYQELSRRIDSFLEVFALIAAEKGLTVEELLDQSIIKIHLHKAQQLQSRKRYREANQYLLQTLSEIEQALSKARDQETLVRTLEFDSVEQEYAYEQERNRSHHMLVQLMLAERVSLANSSRGMIAQFIERSEQQRARAVQLASANQMQAAIETMEKATLQLVRALRVLGVPF